MSSAFWNHNWWWRREGICISHALHCKSMYLFADVHTAYFWAAAAYAVRCTVSAFTSCKERCLDQVCFAARPKWLIIVDLVDPGLWEKTVIIWNTALLVQTVTFGYVNLGFGALFNQERGTDLEKTICHCKVYWHLSTWTRINHWIQLRSLLWNMIQQVLYLSVTVIFIFQV